MQTETIFKLRLSSHVKGMHSVYSRLQSLP